MEGLQPLELADWRRQISDIYREVRASGSPQVAWEAWKNARHDLFRAHPQSPLPSSTLRDFTGVAYFPYDPAYRVLAHVRSLPAKRYDIATSGEGTFAFTRFGAADFEIAGNALSLEVYWLDGYGGGIFLPFRDATSGVETYGGGRYLLDTVKGADLGTEDDRLVLDFNFAYNPSCSYDPRWVCPLSPPENHLDARIEAGERYP